MNQLLSTPATEAVPETGRPVIQGVEAAIDLAILGPLLAMGDAEHKRALCRQLISDFQRIDAGLAQESPGRVSVIAHELKGLSGTIGAQRLADIAASLHERATRVGAAALNALLVAVRGELARVISVLLECEQSCNER